jgi:hypothetical protein
MTPETPRRRFSSYIDIQRLERESRRLLVIGLFLGILLHAGIAVFVEIGKPPGRAVVLPHPEKPISTDLIALPPRDRGFVSIRPHPFRKRYLGRGSAAAYSFSTPGLASPRFNRAPDVTDHPYTVPEEPMSSPELQADTDTSFLSRSIGDSVSSQERLDPKILSMQDELLSVEDLLPLVEQRNTGYVFCNPNNNMAIAGAIPLPILYSSSAPPTDLSPSIRFLGDGLKKFTGIVPVVTKGITLVQHSTLHYPFLYIACSDEWEYYPNECDRIREYLLDGGFAVFENLEPWKEGSPGEYSLRQFIQDSLASLGSIVRVAPIPKDHPLYHCFFDFPDGPPIGSEYKTINGMELHRPVLFLEGVWIRERLAGIFSNKGYGLNWQNPGGGDPPLKMGVNMVVYALTQEGGKAVKRFDYSLEPTLAVKRWMSVKSPYIVGRTITAANPGDNVSAGLAPGTDRGGEPSKYRASPRTGARGRR